jgi:hypothetical protein
VRGSEHLHRVGPQTRAAIDALPPGEWALVKKRDHYFLYNGTRRVACVANNASKIKARQDVLTALDIRRYVTRSYAGGIT